MTEIALTLDADRLASIADVARDTGIAKDTLRVWERRYGFPVPSRDGNGERVYSVDQVRRLRLIRRLLDAGLRPNKVVACEVGELESLLATTCAAVPQDAVTTQVVEEIFALVRARQLGALRATLAQALARMGLQRFIIDVLPALLNRVGSGWLSGEIGVPEEHMLSEALQNQLRAAILALPPHPSQGPAVLLTSLPEEDHGLGLLMAEALLESERANCLPLGLRMPLPDIVTACGWAHIDIVALSVSTAYAPGKALKGLNALRALLPEGIALWVGGAGAAQHAATLQRLPNTRLIGHIGDTLLALAEWRAAAAAQAGAAS